jgi:hypothetical protein
MFGGIEKKGPNEGKKGTIAFKVNAACVVLVTAVYPASINDA